MRIDITGVRGPSAADIARRDGLADPDDSDIDAIRAEIGAALDDKQGINENLTAFSALTFAANKLPYITGALTMDVTTLTAAGRALLDDASASDQLTTLGFSAFAKTLVDDANAGAVLDTLGFSANGKSLVAAADYAAMRTALSLVPGTNVQAYSANLASLAGLTLAADRLPYATGANTLALATFTAAGRALLDDASASDQLTTLGFSSFAKTLVDDADAAAARATLGLTIGTDVQAYSAALAGYEQHTSIAAGSTVDMGAVSTPTIIVTGTGASISSFGTPTGNPVRFVKFSSGGNTIVHGTGSGQPNLGGSNIVTESGDAAIFVKRSSSASYWDCISYRRASGKALVQPTAAELNAITGYEQSADLAIGSTTDLGSVTATFVRVTGTGTTITSLGTPSGNPVRIVRFNSAGNVISHGTSAGQPNLGGMSSITTTAGDLAVFVKRSGSASYWELVSYRRADGGPLNGPSFGDVAQTQRRPGDALSKFSATITGESSTAHAAPAGTVTNGTHGRMLIVAGGTAAFGTRERIAVEDGRKYRVRWRFARNANPTTHALQYGFQWLTNGKASNGQELIAVGTLNTTSGARSYEATISNAAGPGVDYVWPSGTKYVVPIFDASAESDGSTALYLMGEWADVTDLPDSAIAGQPARTIVCLGDSNMQGNTLGGLDKWSVGFAERLGATVHNCGIGGTRMTATGVTNRNNLSFYGLMTAIDAGDFTAPMADVAALIGAGSTNYTEEVEAIEAIDWSEVTHLLVGYATNDFHGPGPTGVPIGTLADTDGTASFIGAMRGGIELFWSDPARQHVRLIFETPVYRRVDDMRKAASPPGTIDSVDSDDAVNGSGHTLQDYAQAIRDVADLYHIPVIDLNVTSGINALNWTAFIPESDGLHYAQTETGIAHTTAMRASGFLRHY